MDLIFYLSKYGAAYDKLISVATESRYCHVEIRFSDGMCFSSSFPDGGTRLKKLDVEPTQWDVLTIPTTPEQEAIVRDWCKTQVGLPYDMLGMLCIFLPGDVHTPGAWYCSNVCATALNKIDVHRYPLKLSPGQMYDITKDFLHHH